MDFNRKTAIKRLVNWENLPFIVLTLLLILLPVFFIASPVVSLQFSKLFLLVIGIVVAFASFLVTLIKKGSFVFPRSLVLFGLLVLTVVYVLSASFSNSSVGSFIGYGYEVSTFAFILMMTVLVYMVSVVFNDSRKLFLANMGFLLAAGVLGVFYILRLWIGADFLSFGFFTDIVSNTLGRWNELGIFFALSSIVSLIALEVLSLNRIAQVLLYILLVISLFMAAVVNFLAIWYILGIVVLLFFVFFMSSPSTSAGKMAVVDSLESGEISLKPFRRRIAVKSLVVLVIIVLFVLPIGRDFGNGLANRFNLNSFEVRPSWISTLQIFRATFGESPFLGVGPNRFFTEWQLHRPDVNASNYWSVNFESGIGFVPTAFIETGILGALAWLLFFLAILYTGFRALSRRSTDQANHYLLISSFAATVFLWIMGVIYVPGMALLVTTFFFTGLFIATSIITGVVPLKSFSFTKNQTLSFVSIIGCVVLLLAGVGLGYVLFERGRSSIYFQKGVVALNSQDVAKGEGLISKALDLARNDIYYRTLAESGLIKINAAIANAAAKVANRVEITEDERAEFQNNLSFAIQTARLAESRDPSNFENKAIVGRIYGAIVPVGVDQSYEAAKTAFQEALRLSPRNPGLYLELARLEIAKNNLDGANQALAKAIELKWNYVDAIFFQSQVEVLKGDIPSAIRSAEQASAITPDNPLAFFRVGLLKYESKNYLGAVEAFEKSIRLVPVYANAKYFLGLSYSRVGRRTDAIAQFEDLKRLNPDNQEVDMILTNLKAQRDPFANAGSSADLQPEKRKELPVEEKN